MLLPVQAKIIPEIKKIVSSLVERGGVIRTMENLGERQLPYKMIANAKKHITGR